MEIKKSLTWTSQNCYSGLTIYKYIQSSKYFVYIINISVDCISPKHLQPIKTTLGEMLQCTKGYKGCDGIKKEDIGFCTQHCIAMSESGNPCGQVRVSIKHNFSRIVNLVHRRAWRSQQSSRLQERRLPDQSNLCRVSLFVLRLDPRCRQNSGSLKYNINNKNKS